MPTLAEIYLAKGRAESDRELRRAAIEAERSRGNAAIWGNALTNVGGIAANAITSYGEQKQRQPLVDQQVAKGKQDLERGGIELQGMKDKQAAIAAEPGVQQAIGKIWSDARTRDPQTGAPMIDHAKLLDGLTAAGLAGRYDKLKTMIESFEKNAKEANEKQAAAVKDLAGMVADGGFQTEDFIIGVDELVQRGLMSETYAIPLIKRAKEDPNFVKAYTSRIAGIQPDKPVVVGAGSSLVDPSTGNPIYQAPAATPPPAPFTLGPGQQRFGPDGKPIASVAPTPPQGATAPVSVIGPDGKPIYVTPQQALGMTPASNREQGRPVTSGDANAIADFDTALTDLATLTGEVPAGTTGPVAEIGAAMPNFITAWTGIGASAKAKQAVIDRVKQVIGKALEGGVLRKEDEIKYAKILPTIGDVDTVVKAKLEGLKKSIEQRRSITLDNLSNAGFDTSRFALSGATATNQPQAPTRPPGVPASAVWTVDAQHPRGYWKAGG